MLPSPPVRDRNDDNAKTAGGSLPPFLTASVRRLPADLETNDDGFVEHGVAAFTDRGSLEVVVALMARAIQRFEVRIEARRDGIVDTEAEAVLMPLRDPGQSDRAL